MYSQTAQQPGTAKTAVIARLLGLTGQVFAPRGHNATPMPAPARSVSRPKIAALLAEYSDPARPDHVPHIREITRRRLHA